MTWMDGQGHRLWGSPGLFAVDGTGTAVAVALLAVLVVRSGVTKTVEPVRDEAGRRRGGEGGESIKAVVTE